MNHFVYIAKSKVSDKYYIGCTSSLESRGKHHNGSDKRRFVYKYRPWEILMWREFNNQTEAYQYEKLIKSYKGGNAFKRILNGEVAEWSKALHC